jgi:acid phosphatase type 7
MLLPRRRTFLATGAISMASVPWLFGQEPAKTAEPAKKTEETKPYNEPFNPDTLFLTWHTDPTTTCVVQWIGSEWEYTIRDLQYAEVTAEYEKARDRDAKLKAAIASVKTAEETILLVPETKKDEAKKEEPKKEETKPDAAKNDEPKADTPKKEKNDPAKLLNWQKAPVLVKPFLETDLKVFRAEIGKLKPGTEYVFRVGTGTEYRFRTMPAKATNTFQFISGGDCGVNDHALANNRLAAKQDPYFVLIMGDLGYDNGRSARTALNFIKNYSGTMKDSKGRLIPLVAGIGNHEVNGGYAKQRKDSPFFLSLFDGLYKDTTYATLDFGDYLSLVLLDSGHIAPIGGEQTDWLGKQLAARQDRTHLFVANHVPAYPSFREPTVKKPEGPVAKDAKPEKFGTGEEQRMHWVPLFEKYSVDIVLEHHDHTFKRTHPLLNGLKNDNGVVYLGDGSWGMLRVPKTPDKRPYLATVGGAYHFTIHRLDGDVRYHVAMDEGSKIVDITATRKRARSSTKT